MEDSGAMCEDSGMVGGLIGCVGGLWGVSREIGGFCCCCSSRIAGTSTTGARFREDDSVVQNPG